MAKQTLNYGFVKPDTNDFYDVATQNANWDKVDALLKEIQALQAQLATALSEAQNN